MRLVFNLSFGKSGAAMHTPVHRFLPLVDHPLLDEPAQRPDDVRLVGRLHRQVGIVPFAEDAEAFEILAHDVDVFGGVCLALPPEIGDTHLAFLRTELPVDLELDGQPVTVPPRHIGCIQPGHAARLHHEVFEHLVEGRADVDFSVGVGRPVVKHKFLGT
jgi:hypothetical protein